MQAIFAIILTLLATPLFAQTIIPTPPQDGSADQIGIHQNAHFPSNSFGNGDIETLECNGVVTPDRAFVVVHFTSVGQDPIKLSSEIDSKLSEIKLKLADKIIEFTPTNRLRLTQREDFGRFNGSAQNQIGQFTYVQEVELSINPKDVDKILAQISALGVTIGSYNQIGSFAPNGMQPLAFYGFSNTEEISLKLINSCIAENLQKNCMSMGRSDCKSLLPENYRIYSAQLFLKSNNGGNYMGDNAMFYSKSTDNSYGSGISPYGYRPDASNSPSGGSRSVYGTVALIKK